MEQLKVALTEPGKDMYKSLTAQIIMASAARAGFAVEYVPFQEIRKDKTFDIWLVSLHHVRDYWRLPLLFRRLGVEPLADKRKGFPLFIAGGGPLTNPLPVAAFFDVICIGEGEEWIQEALHLLNLHRDIGCLENIEGTYLPVRGRKQEVKRRVFRDIDGNGSFWNFYSEGYSKGIKDVLYIEVARGCRHRCRFCKLSWMRKEIDEWTLNAVEEELTRQAKLRPDKRYINLNAPDIGSVSWYPKFPDILERYGYNMPYTSIRFDSFQVLERLKKNQLVRLGLEGMSRRLRRWLNKGDWDTDYIVEVMRRIYCEQGLPTAKWFIITSLPAETEADREEFYELMRRLMNVPPRWGILRISATNFVPEPHTPMQWFPARYSEESNKAVENARMVVRSVKRRFRTFGVRPVERAVGKVHYYLDVAATRGDESFAKLILIADERKRELSRLKSDDLLDTYIKFGKEVGCNIEEFLGEQKEDLPWDFIDVGTPKATLRKIYKKMREAM